MHEYHYIRYHFDQIARISFILAPYIIIFINSAARSVNAAFHFEYIELTISGSAPPGKFVTKCIINCQEKRKKKSDLIQRIGLCVF